MPRSSARPSLQWRVVDIVVTAVIGVAAGVVFIGWNIAHEAVTAPAQALLPGLQGLFHGVWLFAGVLAGIVVRKPGAAVVAEVVAAFVSAPIGSWGFLTLESGLVQGLGAELVLLIFLYRRWGLPVAMLAGTGAGLAMAVNDLLLWYVAMDAPFKIVYFVSCLISGAVIAGLGSWALARGLAATGVLSRFASGREARAKV